MRRIFVAIAATLSLSILIPMNALAGASQASQVPTWKVVSPEMIARSKAKQALALELYAAMTGQGSLSRYKHDLSLFVAKWGNATFASSKGITQLTATPPSFTLNMGQYPEQSPSQYCVSGVLTCYCGPSAAESILEYLQPTSYSFPTYGSFVLVSNGNWTNGQYGLAGTFGPGSPKSNWFLETNLAGGETAWFRSSSDWPMSMSFNYWSSGSVNGYPYYTEDPAPYSGHVLTQTEYNANLTSDIQYYFPLAADVEEISGTTHPHLYGHPANLEVQHWIALYGYSSNGWYTDYIDPIYGSALNGTYGFNVSAFNSGYYSGDMHTLVTDAGPHGGPYGIVW